MAGVVGRVDIDELDLASVGFAQDLQRVEVVALDVKVLGGVPVLAAFLDRTQRFGDGLAGLGLGGPLAGPSELVAFARVLGNVAELVAQRIEVDGFLGFAGLLVGDFGEHVGEQCDELVHVLLGEVGRAAVNVLDVAHCCSPWLVCHPLVDMKLQLRASEFITINRHRIIATGYRHEIAK